MSKNTVKVSFCRNWLVSRRISLAIHSLSGAESCTRAATYTFSPSNMIQASVRSVAGAPSTGTCCRKSVIGGTVSYTSSSSTPSRRMPVSSRMARTVVRPSASRFITAGATGAGGPSMAAASAGSIAVAVKAPGAT